MSQVNAPPGEFSRELVFDSQTDRTLAAGLRAATRDVLEGALHWPRWLMLGNHDIIQRYRRSTLGPFWITLSTGIMVAALSVLYSRILSQDLNTYVPYLTSGLLIWTFISMTLTEGCSCFSDNEGIIKQVSVPLSVYIYRTLWRNLIVLLHNGLILVLVYAVFTPPLSSAMLLAIPGFLILCLNMAWVVLLLAILCTRFRDVVRLVISLLQLALFITPIFWRGDRDSSLHAFALWNPLFYVIELVRAPLLGTSPTFGIWAGALVGAVAGWALVLLIFARVRWRVAYWL